jgi:hypothetical protein
MSKYNEALEGLIRKDYEFKFSQYINDGFKIFSKNIGGFVIYHALALAIISIISFIFYGFGSLLQPAFVAGIFLVANETLQEKNTSFNKFFEGFNFFVPLIFITIVSGIFVLIGVILLLVPGIYLAISYQFANMLVIFLGYDFWEAMEFSRKIITKKWWHFFGFTIVLGLINILGAITIVGILFTAPATMCMLFCAFEDIVGGAVRELENNNSDNSNTTYTYNI